MAGRLLIFSLCFWYGIAQNSLPFQKGEWLKYRLHYGALTAGYCTLTIEKPENEQAFYRAVLSGWSAGAVHWFFKVKDTYISKIDAKTLYPFYFERDIKEGGYFLHRTLTFQQAKKIVTVANVTKNTTENYLVKTTVHDIFSAFYFLRTTDFSTLKKGSQIQLPIFLDGQVLRFQFTYKGDEILKTKLGNIKCHKLIPQVLSGRVFKDKESVLFYVTADKNKIPVRIKIKISVGSVKADLIAYKGLAHPMPIIFNQ